MNQRTGRTNTFSLPATSSAVILLFSRISSRVLSSFLEVVAVAGRPERFASVTLVAIFEHFNPLIDNSTRENFIPILSTHAEMNLCSRHTCCPQKAYDRTLFLFGAIYKFCSHFHHSVTTLILNCKVCPTD